VVSQSENFLTSSLGIGIATTRLAIPAILRSPNKTLQAQQWRSIYNQGIYFGPPLALLSCANFIYLAYSASSRGDTNAWRGFATAAAIGIAVIPFTAATLLGINGQLVKASERQEGEGDGLDEGSVRDLLERWAWINGLRSLAPLTAGVVGLWTAVK
jgi:hypothetical protein